MGGLIADIQPPNLETRMAIIRQKAEIDGLSLPNEVVQFIANNITSNVRELEGTLIKMIASSSFTGRDITLSVAQELCGDVIARKNERITIKLIQQKVAESFGISPNQLTAHTRKRDVSFPRSVAIYLCKKMTNQSLRTIGLDFGGRDYSTMIYSCKKIDNDLQNDRELQGKIATIEKAINS
jgi:chromosomal replication initiator protein